MTDVPRFTAAPAAVAQEAAPGATRTTAGPRPVRSTRKRSLPLLLKRKAAARFCGFTVPTWDRMSAAGLNPAGRKIGGSRYYETTELRAWVRHGCPRRGDWQPVWDATRHRRDHR